MSSVLPLVDKIEEDFLTCSVCCDSFRVPKLLECQHTFCLECIKCVWERSGKRKIKCPLCRQDTFKRPDQLTNNFLVNQFVTLTEKLKTDAVINNNEDAKLQQLIEKEKDERERVERIVGENGSRSQSEPEGWDEKEIELATVESILIESKRILKIAIEKENVYARMLRENFHRLDELNRKARHLQDVESKLLKKQREIEASSENQRPVRRRRRSAMVGEGNNKNVLDRDRVRRNMIQRQQAHRHRIENERARAMLERETALNQNRVEEEKARRRMEEIKIETAHLAEQMRLEQQRFQNSQMNSKKPDSWTNGDGCYKKQRQF